MLCQPIQISELPPDFQVYAQRAQKKKYRQLIVGLIAGPALIAVYFWSVSSSKALNAPWLLWVLIFAAVFLIGASIYSLRRKRNLLPRYYRLAALMQHVEPIDAELQYEIWNQGSRSPTRCYFKVCQLAPGAKWPEGVGQKIQVDVPPDSEEVVVTTKDFWKKLAAGYDPFDKPKLWGKVYFDPDQSGSAVISIQDGLFVSVSENNRFS